MTAMVPLLLMSAMTASDTKYQTQQIEKPNKYPQEKADRDKLLAKIKANREERNRRSKAKLRISHARAKMAASGISSSGGSNLAILRGLRLSQNNDISEIRYNKELSNQNTQIKANRAKYNHDYAKNINKQNSLNKKANRRHDRLFRNSLGILKD